MKETREKGHRVKYNSLEIDGRIYTAKDEETIVNN